MINTKLHTPKLQTLVTGIFQFSADGNRRPNFVRMLFAWTVLALCIAPLSIASAIRTATPPELPREFLDTTYHPPTGRTIAVNAGEDFQAALNSAAPGDVITLQRGATFTGNFLLPHKAGSDWIVIRSSAPDDSLPQAGARITPAFADALPKIVTPNSQPALTASDGAHHFRLIGLEFTAAPDVQQTYSLIQLGDNQASLSLLPHHLILDRVYIHGNPTVNLRRGVALNSASTAVIDSYISECHEVGADSQAICGWNGPGPFKIVNNYLEGAGENVMFGGADPAISGLTPSDIEFRRNHCFKPLSWRIEDSSYAGTPWTVKNLFELKNAQRVLIEGNIFEHNWAQSQIGFAILFTVRNQDGNAPWSVVQDVTFTNNIVRHSTGGVNMHSSDDIFPSEPARRLLIKNNLFDDIGAFSDGSRMFQMGGSSALNPAVDVTFDHNTCVHHEGAIQYGQALVLGDSGKVAQDFIFTNNIITRAPYGVKGSGTGEGKDALDSFMEGYTFSKNVVIDNPAYSGGSSLSSLYPTGNFFTGSHSEVGFTDYHAGNGGDYRLVAASPYKSAGTDGKDIGCDFDALNAALGDDRPVTASSADLRITVSNGANSVSAGGATTYTIIIVNSGPQAADNAIFSYSATGGLSLTGVSCDSESGGAKCPAPASLTASAIQGTGIGVPALPSGGSVTFAVTARVTAESGSVTGAATITPPDGVNDPAPGNNAASDADTVTPRASVPGDDDPNSVPVNPRKSEAGDDKAGSLLIYNIYSSSITSPTSEDTRITITNTNPNSGVVIHFFLIDGGSCSVADFYVCLTANQTTRFQTSEFDPGVTGYLVAVAVDDATGCPRSFNHLTGEASVRLSSGHHANLSAVAVSALYEGLLPGCDENSITATIVFNGTTGYSSLPRVLALDNIPDPASGNVTLLILNRIGGDLTVKADALGSIFGLLYNDDPKSFSFTAATEACQFRSLLTNDFPRTTPRLERIIQPQHSGWMRLWLSSEAGLLGAMINFNRNAGSAFHAFNGGHNLHNLTLTTNSSEGVNSFTIPVFPLTCSM